MSKRIEELEKEIKERKNKRYNCNWDFIKSSQNIYDLQARIQERKLAEKEFLELIDNFRTNPKVKLIHNLDGIEIDFLMIKQSIAKNLKQK